jgi:hypothetical protein
VQVLELGKTTLGEDLIMTVISSEANMAKLPRLKQIARDLSDPRGWTTRGSMRWWTRERWFS